MNLKVEDYVVSVASELGKTKKDVRQIIKEFISQVKSNTQAGVASQFTGLGKIEIVDVEGGEKRNPKTGEPVYVEAHQKPKFKFSGKVRNTLRGIEDTEVDED